jgi:hypothetical protein
LISEGIYERPFTPEEERLEAAAATARQNYPSQAVELTDVRGDSASLTAFGASGFKRVSGKKRHAVAPIFDEWPSLEELLAKVPQHRREQILERLSADDINELEAIRILKSELGPPRTEYVEVWNPSLGRMERKERKLFDSSTKKSRA